MGFHANEKIVSLKTFCSTLIRQDFSLISTALGLNQLPFSQTQPKHLKVLAGCFVLEHSLQGRQEWMELLGSAGAGALPGGTRCSSCR